MFPVAALNGDPTVSSSAHMSQAVSMVSIMQCIVAAMGHLVPYLVPIFLAGVTAHCNNLRGQHYLWTFDIDTLRQTDIEAALRVMVGYCSSFLFAWRPQPLLLS